MSELKCPFCQQKLVRHWSMKEPALYCCDNPKCSRGGVATESAWQELICMCNALVERTKELDRTRKALDRAKDTLHWYNDNYDSVVAQETINEITALEQKDNK